MGSVPRAGLLALVLLPLMLSAVPSTALEAQGEPAAADSAPGDSTPAVDVDSVVGADSVAPIPPAADTAAAAVDSAAPAAVRRPPPPFVEQAQAGGYDLTLKGLKGFEPGHLNRVDGWRPGFGLTLLSVRPNVLPTIDVSAGVRTHRMEEPWVQASVTQLFPSLDRLSISVEGYRETHTPDAWKIGARENDLWVLLTHSDLRNYYEANGAALAVTSSDLRPWGLRLGLRTETNHSLVEDTFFTLTNLFGDVEEFRPNPPVAEGRVTSAALEARLLTAATQSPSLRVPGWNLEAVLERAGSALGGDVTFWAGTVHLRRYSQLAERHWLNARLYLSGPVLGTRTLPRQRWTYLGGPGSLPGFDTLVIGGDRGILATAEYTFQLPTTSWSAPVFLLWQLEVFSNAGNAVAGEHPDLTDDLHWDAGAGISGVTVLGYLGVFVAQRLSHLEEEASGPRFLFRLQRTF